MAEVGGSELLQEFSLQVLDVPEQFQHADGSSQALALVVLRRQHGGLLALPSGVLSDEALASGLMGEQEDALGLSTVIQVEAGSLQDPEDLALPEAAIGSLVDVVLIDVSGGILELLAPFNASLHHADHVQGFNINHPELVPMPADLVAQTWAWIQDPMAASLVTYYSAEEGEVVPETPTTTPTRRTRGRAAQPNGGGHGETGGDATARRPRPTVASIAASLEQFSAALPALVNKVDLLTSRQEAMEAQMHQQSPARVSALRQPLGASPTIGSATPSLRPEKLIRDFPPPPARNTSTGTSRPSDHRVTFAPAAEQLAMEKNMDVPEDLDNMTLTQAVLAQSRALTTLVAQLATGDPMTDLGSSSTTLSTKGAQGRAKLMQELAMQRGTFFTSVIQSMSRRLQPARPADLPTAELAERGVLPTLYLERFGGYGKTRDLGCLQWQLMMILDNMLLGNIEAAKDGAALMAVCLEQASMDSGRLDIGMLLALCDDPPAGVFQHKSTTAFAKGRAFAPLAEQRWVTIALAYIKEMDLITSKRQDATGSRDKDPPPSQPNPKKAPKKSGKGGGKKGSQNKEEEE